LFLAGAPGCRVPEGSSIKDENMALGLKALFDSGCRKIAVVWFSGEDDETSKACKAYRQACQDPGNFKLLYNS